MVRVQANTGASSIRFPHRAKRSGRISPASGGLAAHAQTCARLHHGQRRRPGVVVHDEQNRSIAVPGYTAHFTTTPFQNATRPMIWLAAGFGSG